MEIWPTAEIGKIDIGGCLVPIFRDWIFMDIIEMKYGGNKVETCQPAGWYGLPAEIGKIDTCGYWIFIDIIEMKYGGNRSVA